MDELVVATVARFDDADMKYWSKNMHFLDLGNFIAIFWQKKTQKSEQVRNFFIVMAIET